MAANRKSIKSNLATVDAHRIAPHEYDEAPELTAEQFAGAVVERNGVPVRRGRPRAAVTKVPINVRLDRDVLAHFREGGPGWQTRINEALRAAIKRDEPMGRAGHGAFPSSDREPSASQRKRKQA